MANEEGHSNTQRSQVGRFVLDCGQHDDSETQQNCREHLDEAALCNTRPSTQANIDFHRAGECARCNTSRCDSSNDLSDANGDRTTARDSTHKVQCQGHLGIVGEPLNHYFCLDREIYLRLG